MLPDIRHLIKILVDATFTAGVPEKRLMGPGGAGSDHHPVEPLFTNGIGDLLGIVRRAGKKAFLGMYHIFQGRGVFDHGRHIHHPPDIGAAMAHEDADSRLFARHIAFRWVDPVLGQITPAVGQQLTAKGIGAAGGDHRLGNIDGSLERSADKNPGTRGLNGIGRLVFGRICAH